MNGVSMNRLRITDCGRGADKSGGVGIVKPEIEN